MIIVNNPLDFLIPGLWVLRLIRACLQQEHTWVVMGDAASGKTEFLCMLQDMERDPKGKTELSHSEFSTPGNKITKVKAKVTTKVLKQTIAFCDGPGALKQKKTRMDYILNNAVKDAIDQDERLVLVYMVDMSKIENEGKLDTACNLLLAEVGMFFRGFKQILKEKEKASSPKKEEVSEETAIARVGGKVFVIGTHMDEIKEDKRQKTNEIISAINNKKMEVAISPFLKCVNFEFVFGDIYNYKGRCDFLKELGHALKGKE